MASRDRLAPSASGLLSEKGKQIGPSGPSRRKKVMALLALTVQNAVYALIIKYSRTAPRAHGGHYLASSVVVVTEIAKAIVALGLLQVGSKRTQRGSCASRLADPGCSLTPPQWETGKAIPLLIANDWKQSYLFAFPATVYTVQARPHLYSTENHVFLCSDATTDSRPARLRAEQPIVLRDEVPRRADVHGARRPGLPLSPAAVAEPRTAQHRRPSAAPHSPHRALPHAPLQVLSQAKILTTAVFTVLLLGRRLHRVRWRAAPQPPSPLLLPPAEPPPQ